MPSFFPSITQTLNLDSLTDVEGFDSAEAGTPYAFLKTQEGTTYRPVSASSAISIDPNGGLELNAQDQIKIKPDETGGNSGVGLSSDGLEIVDRVKDTGDSMSGTLKFSNIDWIESTTDSSTNTRLGQSMGGGFLFLVGGADESVHRLDVQGKALIETETTGPALEISSQGAEVMTCGAGRIGDLGDPTSASQAATKSYVDNNFVAVVGDTMTGTLLFDHSGAWVLDADDNDGTRFGHASSGGFLILKGGGGNASPRLEVEGIGSFGTSTSSPVLNLTSNGADVLHCGGKRITSLNEPINSNEAATKGYVDSREVSNTYVFSETLAVGFSPGNAIADGYHTRALNMTNFSGGAAGVTRSGSTITFLNDGIYKLVGMSVTKGVDQFAASVYKTPGTSETDLLVRGSSMGSRGSPANSSACSASVFEGIILVAGGPLTAVVVVTTNSTGYLADSLGVASAIGVGVFTQLRVTQIS